MAVLLTNSTVGGKIIEDVEGSQAKVNVHASRTDNPHGVTKTQVGLGNVDNTADVNKNVFSATKLATARTISLGGDISGSASFDGTADITITATIGDGSGSGLNADLLDGLDATQFMRSDVSGISSKKKEFYTDMTSEDDWANSPIIIRERNLIGSGSNDDRYSPNLNFHWASVNSKSLAMKADGNLYWGEYSSDGYTPSNLIWHSGNFNPSSKLDTGANAISASKLATARTISLGGDLSGSASFDGTADITISAAVGDDSHNHSISTVNGLQVALDSKLGKTGGDMTGDITFANSGTSFRGITGTVADNDYWRVGGAGTSTSVGYMEIATADDGTEPIYVRQYSGAYTALTRSATLLDESGNTSFPGTVIAPTFSGNLTGYKNVDSGNEITIANGFSGGVLWFNYRGSSSATTEIRFADGLGGGGLAQVRASQFNGAFGMIARSMDEWLRINDDGSHTAGTFFGSTVVRTDGELQVGNAGSAFRALNNGVVTASASVSAPAIIGTSESHFSSGTYTDPHAGIGYGIKASQGISTDKVNVSGKVDIVWNSTEGSLDFVFI